MEAIDGDGQISWRREEEKKKYRLIEREGERKVVIRPYERDLEKE